MLQVAFPPLSPARAVAAPGSPSLRLAKTSVVRSRYWWVFHLQDTRA